jgi:ABC-2 type transport system permease protein
MRTLLARNLRLYAAPLAAVCVGLFAFELLLVWVAARLDTGPGLRELLEAILPPDMRELVFAQLGLASFSGAVSFGFQHPVALAGSIAIIVALATVPAAERESGFLDLVLGRPVTRSRYLGATAVAVLLAAVLLPAALLAGAAAGMALVDAPSELPWPRYGPSAVGLAFLLLAVGSYALLFAGHARRRGIAIGRAVSLTLVFYWLDFMGAYWDALVDARKLSPFHYFAPGRALESGLGLRDPLALLSGAVIVTAAAFLVFRRQDL